MGLDNGIVLRTKKRLENLPEYIEGYMSWIKPESTDLEIVYFRKCWGLRGEYNNVLKPINSCYFNVTADKIDILIDILNKYTDEEYYEENARSIWEYEDYMYLYENRLLCLQWLKDFLINHADEVVECYWYDSY